MFFSALPLSTNRIATSSRSTSTSAASSAACGGWSSTQLSRVPSRLTTTASSTLYSTHSTGSQKLGRGSNHIGLSKHHSTQPHHRGHQQWPGHHLGPQ